MSEIEELCRGLLANAAARQWVASKVEPESPSADYLTGFGAGVQAGEVAALTLVLGAITGESPSRLIEEAQSQAAVDSAFPFQLHILPADGEAA